MGGENREGEGGEGGGGRGEREEEGRGRKGRECLPFPAWQETHPGRRRKAFGGLDRHRHLND